jgi:hypothetical protein
MKPLYLIFTFVLCTVLIAAAPARAQQGPEIRVTDSQARADQPDVAIDSNGNTHIVYCDDYNTDSREIWYTMLDNNGNTLIDDTRLTDDDGDDSTRPGIVIDSSNRVHITFRDQRWDAESSQEVTYTKLDPFLDDQNGDDADPATITVVDDIRLSNIADWYILGVRMEIDSNDNIHIVWDDYDAEEIFYMKIDEDGNVLVGETVIRSAVHWRALPDIAVDSNDNLHVAWADYEDTNYDELYYMMLDNNGGTLIDATLLTSDDDNYSKWTGITVDYQDMVHIVFQDYRGSTHEIYYTKLDPSLDDQDGDDADPATITAVGITALTPDDGNKSRHPAIASSGNGQQIHITWEESDGPNINYLILDTDGNTLVSDTALTTNDTAEPYTYWTIPYLDVDADGKAHIVWSDYRHGNNEVYYTTYQGPAPDPDLLAPDSILNLGDVGGKRW